MPLGMRGGFQVILAMVGSSPIKFTLTLTGAVPGTAAQRQILSHQYAMVKIPWCHGDAVLSFDLKPVLNCQEDLRFSLTFLSSRQICTDLLYRFMWTNLQSLKLQTQWIEKKKTIGFNAILSSNCNQCTSKKPETDIPRITRGGGKYSTLERVTVRL